MTLRVLIGFLLGVLLPLTSGFIVWLTLRNCNPETRRKRVEKLLVLAPFMLAVLLFLIYMISQ